MCGIHGGIFAEDAASRLRQMMDISKHRGPDGSGISNVGPIWMGHNLLAITEEPDKSIQPWEINKARLCYNGEIWNHVELRDKLIDSGCRINTDSDTEVLANGLYKRGVGYLNKLDGMFAIAWSDGFGNLTLARDQVGVKPLYYASHNGDLVFSSSVKSLLSLGISRKVDREAFNLYMAFGFVPGPRTLVSGISKLCPGEVVQYGADLKRASWNLRNSEIVVESDASPEAFRAAVRDTVHKCLMGRRDIGLFLSGGLDSSMILHEMRELGVPIRTYTTRFECSDQVYNSDADVAKRAAEEYGADHTEILVTREEFLDAIEPCIDVLEEPRYNRSSPAYYLLNKKMGEDGIVVTLSGDGGDEVFTGYPRHHRIGKGWDIRRWHQITRITDHIKFEDIEHLFDWVPQRGFCLDRINNHLIMESMCHLPEDFLIRNDRLGMFFSMEGRFPFTSKAFRSYMLGIPAAKKMDKCLVKEAYTGILPDYIINKPKTGWAVPSKEWLDSRKFHKHNFKPVMSKDYHPETYEAVLTSPLKTPKQKMSMFYFRIWAKQLGIEF